MYMCGLWNIDVWDAQAKYLRMDDISFDFIGGSRKALWGAQKELVVTGKYRKNRSVAWGKPLIFCCNEANDFRFMLDKRGGSYLDASEKQWYIDNAVIVEITTRMY